MDRRFSNEQMDIWLTILDKAIKEEKLDDLSDSLEQFNWKEFFNICVNNNITSFVYSSIEKSDIKKEIPKEFWDELKNITQFVAKRQIVIYIQLRKILSLLKSNRLVFFKGPILANLYPNYLLRSSSDTDIWVPKEQFMQVEQGLFQLGYLKNEEESKPQVGVYYHGQNYHVIELHTKLWEDYTGKKIDILSEMELTKNESLIELEVCGVKVTTLGHTEHLIYQMFHIIKHFSLQGIGIRYLADISLFINKYSEEIDWTRFWKSIEKLGYTKFCNNFFDICSKYFGMCRVTLEDSRNEWELAQNQKWDFLEDLFKKGQIDDQASNWQIYGAMTPYFTGEYNAPKEGWRKKLLILFPNRRSLPNNYGYAKKCPILLPIAWIHRIILFFIHRITSRGTTYNAAQKMNVTQYRLQMMESMGLMEE